MTTKNLTPIDHAKNILTRTADSADPVASAALAQGWALLAIAERLEELAQVTREVHQNPLALNAVPFASKEQAPVRPASPLTPAFPVTGTVIKNRRPVVILRTTPQIPTARD
ncbi:MAG: hypothetical protein H7288_07635 [Kineosporiaceae bacterium]|nr:hypothetical protein [Aeromicrobium sp.]